MMIQPVQWDALGNPTRYRSGKVMTVIAGQYKEVGRKYEGKTQAEVISQAFMNAQVKHMIHDFAKAKFNWR